MPLFAKEFLSLSCGCTLLGATPSSQFHVKSFDFVSNQIYFLNFAQRFQDSVGVLEIYKYSKPSRSGASRSIGWIRHPTSDIIKYTDYLVHFDKCCFSFLTIKATRSTDQQIQKFCRKASIIKWKKVNIITD